MAEILSEQLADYRASWRERLPVDRQGLMDQHVAHRAASSIDHSAKQIGDHAPDIRLRDQHGEIFDVATLLTKGPVIVTFCRGGWCPFCNLELKACQSARPRIVATGASMVAISLEKPDVIVSTAEKNALSFPVVSNVNQAVGKVFRVVYAFTDDVRRVYDAFKLDIPSKDDTPDDRSLPLSATYVIGKDGVIQFADTCVDYRERTDPLDVLRLLEHRAAAE